MAAREALGKISEKCITANTYWQVPTFHIMLQIRLEDPILMQDPYRCLEMNLCFLKLLWSE